MAKKSPRSQFEPLVRDGLCRHVRAKGMILNSGSKTRVASAQEQYLAVDRNALPFDATIWWCSKTVTAIGPDDRPCHGERCREGRSCWEAETGAGLVA